MTTKNRAKELTPWIGLAAAVLALLGQYFFVTREEYAVTRTQVEMQGERTEELILTLNRALGQERVQPDASNLPPAPVAADSIAGILANP